jgi:hypothetical protein
MPDAMYETAREVYVLLGRRVPVERIKAQFPHIVPERIDKLAETFATRPDDETRARVMELFMQGKGKNEIAAELGITPGAVWWTFTYWTPNSVKKAIWAELDAHPKLSPVQLQQRVAPEFAVSAIQLAIRSRPKPKPAS